MRPTTAQANVIKYLKKKQIDVKWQLRRNASKITTLSEESTNLKRELAELEKIIKLIDPKDI